MGQTTHFWVLPEGIVVGADNGLRFLFRVLDAERDWEEAYHFYTSGKKIAYLAADRQQTWYEHRGVQGAHVVVPYNTDVSGFAGNATLVSRPTEQMRPPVYEPVPHEVTLRVGRWIHFQMVLPLTFVMYGRADTGVVEPITSPISNKFFERQAEKRDAELRERDRQRQQRR